MHGSDPWTGDSPTGHHRSGLDSVPDARNGKEGSKACKLRAARNWRTPEMRRSLLAAGILAVSSLRAGAQDKPEAFIGARVIPITGPEIQKGVVVVEKGKVVAVGAEGVVKIPPDAVRHDVTGKVVMPGLVDTHSHLGGVEGADSSAPIQPDARALDSINVQDARFKKAQSGGITTVNIMPGSGHLLSGQTVYLKLRNGKEIEDLLALDPKA